MIIEITIVINMTTMAVLIRDNDNNSNDKKQ